MCKNDTTHGLRMFLYGVLLLIKSGVSLSCEVVEDRLNKGIASLLYSKYSKHFDDVGFNPDYLDDINEFYKNSYGIADGRELSYDCTENDGLYLLIKLALNEIF